MGPGVRRDDAPMLVSLQNVGNGPAFLLRSPAIRATLGSPLRVLIKSSFDRAFRVPNAAARLSAARLFPSDQADMQ